MDNNKKTDTPRGVEEKLDVFLGWILGVFLCLNSFVYFFSGSFSGFSTFVGAALVLPPAVRFLRDRYNFNVSAGMRFLLAILFFFFSIFSIGASPDQFVQQSTPAPEIHQTTAQKRYRDTEYFVGAQIGIEKYVQYPRTVEYGGYKVEPRGDDQMVVVGRFSVENGFGVPSDHAYVVWLKPSVNGVHVTDVYIDGETMYQGAGFRVPF